jgi:hypothetical protein
MFEKMEQIKATLEQKREHEEKRIEILTHGFMDDIRA